MVRLKKGIAVPSCYVVYQGHNGMCGAMPSKSTMYTHPFLARKCILRSLLPSHAFYHTYTKRNDDFFAPLTITLAQYTHYEIEGTEIQGTVLKIFKNKGHQYSNF